ENSRKRTKMPTEQEAKARCNTFVTAMEEYPDLRGAPGKPSQNGKNYDRVANFNKVG
ncbi:hypothetical protein TNCV_2334581, partial [Trichonephila clavipes]